MHQSNNFGYDFAANFLLSRITTVLCKYRDRSTSGQQSLSMLSPPYKRFQSESLGISDTASSTVLRVRVIEYPLTCANGVAIFSRGQSAAKQEGSVG